MNDQLDALKALQMALARVGYYMLPPCFQWVEE